MGKQSENRSDWSVLGAVGAALLSSTCCTVPLVLVSAGVGGAWMSNLTALSPFRHLFAMLAIVSMGFAFLRSFRTRQSSDCPSDGRIKPAARNLLLGVGTVSTLALIASPWLLPAAIKVDKSTRAPGETNLRQVTLSVGGMTCPSCATAVLTALNRTNGVVDAQATYSPPRVVVRYDRWRTRTGDLITAVTNTGYRAEEVSDPEIVPAVVDPMPTVRLDELRAAFNASSDDVRVLAILSPTCAECIRGHEVISNLFDRFDSDRLRALLVWLPMHPGDNAYTATTQAGTFNDDRLLLQGWDARREIGEAFEKTLHLTRTAWDVYLVYDQNVTWTGDLPPAPSYWMHQLTKDSGADQRYCLNPAILTREIEKRLDKAS